MMRQPEASPRTIGPYEILRPLGRGGMGVVYAARAPGSPTEVAVKTVATVSQSLLSGLRAEVMALRRLEHPSVVRILDEGFSDTHPWYAMELVQGRTLAELNVSLWPALAVGFDGRTTLSASGSAPDNLPGDTAENSLSDLPRFEPAAAGHLQEVLTTYARLCAPLCHIHSAGLVHRDLKPSNVMLRVDGAPVLMDFGMASRALGSLGREGIDVGNWFIGSVAYASPEQLRREFVDARADLYSLGCMLYETLTGRPPYLGRTVREVVEQHLDRDPPPRPSQLVTNLPPELEHLVLSLLAKRARDRIGHADDLAAALRALGARVVPEEPRTSVSVPYLYRPELAGRRDVMATLQRHRVATNDGRGALVLIAGESGIGKTFLAAESARQAALQRPAWAVITGECVAVSSEAGPAETRGGGLHPFRRLFQHLADRCLEGGEAMTERLFGGQARLLAPYEPRLSGLPGVATTPEPGALPPEPARQRLYGALADVITRLVSESPAVIVLDDLQWADELSLGFLESLPEGFFSNTRLLMLGLYRLDEASTSLRKLSSRADAVAIHLDRLGPAEVGFLVGDMLAMSQPPEALVRFVVERAEGNPFFAAEYLRLAAAEGLVQRRGGRWLLAGESDEAALAGLSVPRSLQQIVARRLAGLSARERHIVEAAAVLGRVTDDDLLARVTGLEPLELAEVMRELTARQVLEPAAAGRHRFVHDKLREVAYAELSPQGRGELHRAAGLALEAQGVADQHLGELGHHFKSAGDLERATDYLDRAARQALSRFANHEAEHFLRELLIWGETQGSDAHVIRAGWERGLGDALHGMGRHEESRQHLARAVTLVGHRLPARAAGMTLSLLSQFARQVLHRVRPRSAAAQDEQVRRRAAEASQAYDRLLQIAYYQGQPLDMFHATLRTLNLAEVAGPSPELAMAYSIAHAVAGIMPIHPLAEAYMRKANEALARAYDPAVDSYLQLLAGVYRSGIGQWQRAQEAFGRGLALAEKLGFRRRADEIRLGLATLAFLQGDYREAHRHTEQPRAPGGREDAQAEAWHLLTLAQVEIAQGAVEDAAQRTRRAEGLADRLQRSELIWLHALRARTSFLLGHPEEAASSAQKALEHIVAGPPVTFYCVEAYAATAEILIALIGSGVAPAPAARAGKALQAFARVFPAARPRAALIAGQLAARQGRRGRASKLYRQSARLAGELQMPPDDIVAHWRLASTVADPGERARLLAQALGRARDLQAWGLSEAIARELNG